MARRRLTNEFDTECVCIFLLSKMRVVFRREWWRSVFCSRSVCLFHIAICGYLPCDASRKAEFESRHSWRSDMCASMQMRIAFNAVCIANKFSTHQAAVKLNNAYGER